MVFRLNIKYVNPKTVSKPTGYTHTIKIEGLKSLVMISGQVSKNVEGDVVGEGNMEKQLRLAFKNLEANLDAAGASFKDVVKLNIYTTDMVAFRRALSEIGKDLPVGKVENPPCQTWIEVKGLARPAYLIEIEAMAALE